jgi:OmpA-OmpF porin, OOP family
LDHEDNLPIIIYGENMQARKFRSALLATSIAAAVGILGAEVQAQTPTFYVIGDVGVSRYNVNVVQDNARTIGGAVDRNSTSGGIALGWQITPQISLELGFTDFGRIDLAGRGSFPCQPAPTCVPVVANLSGDFKTKTTHVSSIGSLPISDQFSIFGRIGVAHTEQAAKLTIAGNTQTGNANETEGIFGLGTSYAFTKNVEGVLEWKWLAYSQVNTATLGIRVRF